MAKTQGTGLAGPRSPPSEQPPPLSESAALPAGGAAQTPSEVHSRPAAQGELALHTAAHVPVSGAPAA
ncbi:MAG: hypothetical protein IT377_15700 [Polyangiaceae bacterium]|nr:hypothetical protein [Polyangiaceae bacterium]